MKKKILLLSCLIGMFSCDNEVDALLQEIDPQPGADISVSTGLSVKMDDVYKYIKAQTRQAATRSAVADIYPITHADDTLMYVINYEEGWEIISADKRCPVLLCFSDEGNLKKGDTVPFGLIDWMDETAEMIHKVKHQEEEVELASNYSAEWENILEVPVVTEVSSRATGYWELINSQSETVTASYQRLTKTEWGQSDPWNTCVPWASDYSQRCVTGCVATAGAQMLYFLHHKLGVPATTYSTGSCTGTPNNYQFSFGSQTAAAWNNMALYRSASYTAAQYHTAAILMGYVGSVIGMNYGVDGSGSQTEKLVSLFSNLGISCSYADYNATTAWTSLVNGMPVILEAYGDRTNKFLGMIYKYKDGHAWIMDNRRTITTTVTNTLRWIATGGDPEENWDSNDRDDDGNIVGGIETTTTSSNTSQYVQMNWGWSGGTNNSTYYQPTGSWITVGDSGETSFQYKRKMIIGFAKK